MARSTRFPQWVTTTARVRWPPSDRSPRRPGRNTGPEVPRGRTFLHSRNARPSTGEPGESAGSLVEPPTATNVPFPTRRHAGPCRVRARPSRPTHVRPRRSGRSRPLPRPRISFRTRPHRGGPLSRSTILAPTGRRRRRSGWALAPRQPRSGRGPTRSMDDGAPWQWRDLRPAAAAILRNEPDAPREVVGFGSRLVHNPDLKGHDCSRPGTRIIVALPVPEVIPPVNGIGVEVVPHSVLIQRDPTSPPESLNDSWPHTEAVPVTPSTVAGA